MKMIATKGTDRIEIEIDEDGTVKLSSDKVSMPNHGNAESVWRMVASLLGGASKRTLKPNISLAQALHKHAEDGHVHTDGTEGGHQH